MKKIMKKIALASLSWLFLCSVSVASAHVSLEMHNNTTRDFVFKFYDDFSGDVTAAYLVTASDSETRLVSGRRIGPTGFYIKVCNNNSNVCYESQSQSCICPNRDCRNAGPVVATVFTDKIGEIQLSCIIPNSNG